MPRLKLVHSGLNPELLAKVKGGEIPSIYRLSKMYGESPWRIKKHYLPHAPANPFKADHHRRGAQKPPAPPLKTGMGQFLIAITLGLIGLALSGAGLALNYRFYFSMGQSEIMGVIGICADCGTAILPAGIPWIWEKRNYLLSLLLTVLLAGCVFTTFRAGIGFSATNIGDGLQGRAAVVDRRRALTNQLSEVQADRAQIIESRDPEAIELLIQAERGRVSNLWPSALKSSDECTNITKSSVACAILAQLKEAKRLAVKRVSLDIQSNVISEQIAALPAIESKDPGAERISRVSGLAPSTTEDFQIWMMALLPCIGGLFLAAARALVR